MFVCWFVCLLFIGHTTFVHFAALPPSTPRAAKPSRATPRASGQAHAQREHARAHAVQLLNEKIAALMPFQKQLAVRARACCRIRNSRDSQKKGKKKTNMPLPKFSLQFAFSWSVYFSNRTESYLIFGRSRPWSSLGVFTFRIVLNRILHKSSLLAPMESRRTRRPTFTAEERLERRREQDRRRYAERRAGERGGSRHRPGGMWIACGLPKPVPRRRWKRRRQGGMWSACGLPKPVQPRRLKTRLLFQSQKLFFVE